MPNRDKSSPLQKKNKSNIANQTIVQIDRLNGNVHFHGDVSVSGKEKHLSNEEKNAYAKSAALETAKMFSDMFYDYLFSEDEFVKKICLHDIYVKTGLISEIGEEFCSFDEITPSLLHDGVLIEGEAGIGKSTLVKCLAHSYIKGDKFTDKNAYFIQGKDIRYSDGNPVSDILNLIGLDEISMLYGAVLIIDGYDEISYVSEDAESNKSYLDRLIFKLEGVSLIITSRPNYIKHSSLYKLCMTGLEAEGRLLFLQKYNSFRESKDKLDEIFVNTLCLENAEYEDGISEILSIPLFLYIIAVNKIDVSIIKDKYDLYELMFDSPDGSGFLSRRGAEIKSQSHVIRNEVYALTLKIAKSMLFSNSLYITENEILRWVENFNISEEKKRILKNRYGVELFLKGNRSNLYTFVHTSVYEYFAAKCICEELKALFVDYLNGSFDLEYFRVKLIDIFPSYKFIEPISYYVMYSMKCEFFNSIFKQESESNFKETNIHKITILLNDLLHSCICDHQFDIRTSFCVKLKNMYLWLYNSFAFLFGIYRMVDNGVLRYHNINTSILKYILRMKGENDYLYVARQNLRNIYLEKYSFSHVHFDENDFYGSSLSDSIFSESTIIVQKFERCLFLNTNFSDMKDLKNLSFVDVDLRFSDFSDSSLAMVVFKNCDMRMVNLTGTDLHGAIFENVYIFKEDLEDAIFDDNDINGFVFCDYSERINPLLDYWSDIYNEVDYND